MCHANDREETLAWKREGSAYEEPEEEGDEAGNAVIALQELTEEQQELERQAILSAECRASRQSHDSSLLPNDTICCSSLL